MSDELDVKDQVEDPSEDNEKPPETDDEGEKKHEPPPDHPRFTEIYGKMKEFQRQLEERKAKEAEDAEVMNALIEHNRQMGEIVDNIQGRVMQTERPDPLIDPEGYDAWIEQRLMSRLNPNKAKLPERKEPAAPQKQSAERQREIQLLENDYAKNNPEYTEAKQVMEPILKSDPYLLRTVLSAPNPARELHKQYKQHKNRLDTERKNKLDQAHVEGGGHETGLESNANKLTAVEKKVAQRLGISEKKMLARKQARLKGGK